MAQCIEPFKMPNFQVKREPSPNPFRRPLNRLHYLIDAPIANVQTDNGSEFYAEFEEALNDWEIAHWFSRVRTPEDNSIAERFNETLQYEWLNDGYFTPNIQEFNQSLTGLAGRVQFRPSA